MQCKKQTYFDGNIGVQILERGKFKEKRLK